MRAHRCDQMKRRRLEFGSTGHCGWRGLYLGLACVPSSRGSRDCNKRPGVIFFSK